MNGGKSLYVIRFYEYSEYNYLVRKVAKERQEISYGRREKSLRYPDCQYSEYSYPVRKVSKRTSRDFLRAIEKVFTLSVFTNIANVTTM